MTFKQQIKTEIIPRLNEMIRKEQDHLLFLKSKRQTPMVVAFVEASNIIIQQLEFSLIQYTQYIK